MLTYTDVWGDAADAGADDYGLQGGQDYPRREQGGQQPCTRLKGHAGCCCFTAALLLLYCCIIAGGVSFFPPFFFESKRLEEHAGLSIEDTRHVGASALAGTP